MYPSFVLALLIVATAASGLLAGASLDQSIKQLPARHRIGAAAFARYSQSADLANGVALYATLGIAVLLFNLAVAIAGFVHGLSGTVAFLIFGGAVLAVLHSGVTLLAAPTNFRQRGATDEAAVMAIFDRFARLQSLRCVLQVFNFAANLCALAIGSRAC